MTPGAQTETRRYTDPTLATNHRHNIPWWDRTTNSGHTIAFVQVHMFRTSADDLESHAPMTNDLENRQMQVQNPALAKTSEARIRAIAVDVPHTCPLRQNALHRRRADQNRRRRVRRASDH